MGCDGFSCALDASLRKELCNYRRIELLIILEIVCVANDRLEVEVCGQMTVIVKEAVCKQALN